MKVDVNAPYNKSSPKPSLSSSRHKTNIKKKRCSFISVDTSTLSLTPCLTNPQTTQKALSRHDVDKWRETMVEEIKVF
jgi:hypothetical protein